MNILIEGTRLQSDQARIRHDIATQKRRDIVDACARHATKDMTDIEFLWHCKALGRMPDELILPAAGLPGMIDVNTGFKYP